MKTVLVLAAFVALALAGSDTTEIEVKTVDETTVSRQYKVLELFEAIYQVNKHASYYEVGLNYNIAAHKDDYKDQEAVENFLKLWRRGFVPKAHVFSIFDYKMRQETIALFELFYTAKNFDVFYATAAWARVHVNEAMFAYTFYIAMTQRLDTNDLVVPPYYEIMPDLFLNSNVVNKMQYTKMRGLPYQEFPFYGIFIHDKENYYYANYSDYYTYSHDEYKISYLTEDIGWNTYYTYFHANMPFYLKGDEIYGGVPKERLGEIYYYIYQQILSRYYLERLTNSIGEIPVFSWNKPFEYGYHPLMTTKFYPFAQRPNKYFMQTDKNLDDLRFIRNYEDLFLDFLEKGQFKEYNKEVNFWDPEAINFVADFWQTNPDLYEKTQKTEYHRSYEMAARRVLGGSSLTYEFKDYKFLPTALDFHQTSLRDPAFYQIYNKILNFIVQYKKFVKPYTKEELSFPGVKINKFEVDKLETFFDFRKFNASNSLYYTEEELIKENDSYMVVQPRLNHKPFNVKVYLKSEVEEEAAFKIFMGPKYDSRGNEIKIEDNWMNFITMDWWTQKLVKGDNVIERKSNDFFYSKKDSLSIGELYKLLEVNQLPKNMLEKRSFMPESLMLPRGQKGGFPVQFFVMVYKNTPLPKEWEAMKDYILDLKPFGFPLDRPMDYYLMQPNMFIEEVKIYHDGSEEPWNLKMEEAVPHSNKVTKH